MVKKVLLGLVILIGVVAGVLVYPVVPTHGGPPSEASALLPREVSRSLTDYADSKETIDALVVASADRVLLEHGETHLPINTHSVRKSVMNVLLGMAVAEGRLSIDSTLAELGIDDAKMPLTEAERQARVSDLLMARSGIYIEASGETPEMKAGRPQRGQYRPGEHYYYNNWDFNTLGGILSQATGTSQGEQMQRLADRLGFEDFSPGHYYLREAENSEHQQYVLFLSARDLAKVGQMMLRQGLDPQGRRLVSEEWVAQSTAAYSELVGRDPLDAYGFLWSLDHDAGTFWATGWGGQFMLVDPAAGRIIVTRNDTGRRLGGIAWALSGFAEQGQMSDVVELHDRLLAGAPAAG